MINRGQVLALIPARGGSKRLPRKNILEIVGKPLIAWSIEAALGSSHVDSVVVSTDDIEIAHVAREYGAEVPFMRDPILGDDYTGTVEVVLHALNVLAEQGRSFEYLVLLQPTSPLRNYEHINKAVELFVDTKADAVISVCETECPMNWTGELDGEFIMSGFNAMNSSVKRTQDYSPRYKVNGAIYIVRVMSFLDKKTLFLDKRYGFVMPRRYSVDIDDDFDFTCAEAILLSR